MNKGFTLVELLVVVLIIGVLSAIALPQYTTAVERSRSVEALSLLSAISDSAQRYYFQHNDTWPGEDQWQLLDIDVPMVSRFGQDGYRGGKNFKLTMKPDPENSLKFIISAERLLNNDSDSKYYLISTIEDKADVDTMEIKRSCSTSQYSYQLAPGTKAEVYCNAITGAENADF